MPHADPPPPRRGAGELEAAVLSVLWQAGRALSAGEVQQALTGQAGAPELSYSTVVTILSRLHAKKALERRRDGRAFRYVPVADEAGLAARRLAAMLDKEPDRHAVLSRFVADLSGSDEQLLRGLLSDGAPEGG
jgi:predicted transcriptional regulator